MSFKEIEEFAKKQGYATAQHIGFWNGYDCYEPMLDEDCMADIGLPLLILVKENTIRMSTEEEALQQLDNMIDDE